MFAIRDSSGLVCTNTGHWHNEYVINVHEIPWNTYYDGEHFTLFMIINESRYYLFRERL